MGVFAQSKVEQMLESQDLVVQKLEAVERAKIKGLEGKNWD